MGYEAAVTAVVLVAVVVALVREIISPPATMLAAVSALVLTRVLDPATGFAGFSNQATLTIAGLFVVARAVQDHSGLGLVLHRFLGREGSDAAALARLVGPIEIASSVIANTPLVAALAPMVRDWAERHGRAASRFLMPVSFAAMLGGVVTTIGTSTTLVVSGLVAQSGGEPFGFLEVTPVGIPVAIVGAIALVALAPRVLPDRRSPYEQVASHERDYTFRLQVDDGGPLDGKDVTAAGLRNLPTVFLARIDRDGHEIAPVGPDTILRGGDVLTFVGQVDHVRELAEVAGLALAPETQAPLLEGEGHGLFEVVLGSNSPLVNRSLKEVSFRGRYGGAVVAIHRAGARVEGKLGEIRLRSGDALLVLADRAFSERWRDHHDFAVVVALDMVAPPRRRKRWIVTATVVGLVVVAGFGWLTILEAVLAACGVLVGTRTVRFQRALQAIDLDVVIIIASAIGLGAAVESSGIAAVLADGVEAVASSAGRIGALAAILAGTMVLTEIITNVAAAALLVPVALDLAGRLDADPTGFAVAIAIGASASFVTPIGYQTNTIVYGLGGYRFTDYWRLGLPLNLVVFVTALLVIPLVWA